MLDERMTALAAAISIDYDYFSQHSHGPGMMPGFLFPMPIPTHSYPDPDAAPGAEAGTEAAADAGSAPEAGPSPTAAGAAPFQDLPMPCTVILIFSFFCCYGIINWTNTTPLVVAHVEIMAEPQDCLSNCNVWTNRC